MQRQMWKIVKINMNWISASKKIVPKITVETPRISIKCLELAQNALNQVKIALDYLPLQKISTIMILRSSRFSTSVQQTVKH